MNDICGFSLLSRNLRETRCPSVHSLNSYSRRDWYRINTYVETEIIGYKRVFLRDLKRTKFRLRRSCFFIAITFDRRKSRTEITRAPSIHTSDGAHARSDRTKSDKKRLMVSTYDERYMNHDENSKNYNKYTWIKERNAYSDSLEESKGTIDFIFQR